MNDDAVIFTKEFWKATGIRAIRTFAQGMLGVVATSAAAPSIVSVDWLGAMSIGAASAIVSVIMSVAYPTGLKEIEKAES